MAKSTVSHRGQVLVLCGAWGFQDFKKVIRTTSLSLVSAKYIMHLSTSDEYGLVPCWCYLTCRGVSRLLPYQARAQTARATNIKTLPPLIGWMRLPSLLWMVQTTGRDPKWVETCWNTLKHVETRWNTLKPLPRCVSDYFRIQASRGGKTSQGPVTLNLCRTRSLVYLWWLKFSPKSSEVKQRQRAQEMNNQNASGATEAGWDCCWEIALQHLATVAICQHLPAPASICCQLPPVYIIPAIPLCHVFQNDCAPPNAQQWELLFTLQLLCLLLPLFWHPGGSCCSEIHCEKLARNNIQQTNTSRI